MPQVKFDELVKMAKAGELTIVSSSSLPPDDDYSEKDGLFWFLEHPAEAPASPPNALRTTIPRNYCLLFCALTPIENPEAATNFDPAEIPENAKMFSFVLEDVDMTTRPEWSQVTEELGEQMYRRIRQNGWPTLDGKPSMIGDLQPSSSQPGGRADVDICPECGSAVIHTKSRDLCASCGWEPDMEPASRHVGTAGRGTPVDPYQPTPESPPPTAFPKGDIIPPTDV